jgi:hypothetical protein
MTERLIALPQRPADWDRPDRSPDGVEIREVSRLPSPKTGGGSGMVVPPGCGYFGAAWDDPGSEAFSGGPPARDDSQARGTSRA